MLDTDTKRRIDTARDILVGKVPDPKSQVEQITIALIYKFMDDMDAESEEFGGKRKFFSGEFARYGWAKLMRSGLGGHEVLNLYGEAIAKMPENPGIPLLFRDIFKNVYLPYRDPETLRAFLKIIDEFNYDHSEKLGDAFEYLLSVLGSQGDAGQFRTPRHIIDFMVDVIDPKKTETVLDPACGTAGFLISSYKHILAANTDAKGSSTLTPDEKGRLAGNFKGYDISPDMVRLSLVNLYLHGFADPHVVEYDTLTSEERWNEYADVILANPPFMSPKGGIKPHKKFSIQAKRSEVLFVDYMAEHLTPTGRAGIIVPEGIIFQSQGAYKDLRRMLVENSLVAVISLPGGCFNPYSGVKTSILILDKSIARLSDTVGFFKVENDGFGLGAQRRACEGDDLPKVKEELGAYLQALRERRPVEGMELSCGLIVKKQRIAEKGEYGLSGERYRVGCTTNSKFSEVLLSSVSEVITKGTTPTTVGFSFEDSGINFIKIESVTADGTILRSKLAHISKEAHATLARSQLRAGDVLFSIAGAMGRSAVVDSCLLPANTNQALAIIRVKEGLVVPAYLAHLLRSPQILTHVDSIKAGVAQYNVSLQQVGDFRVPLPPLEIQREIVAEIEGYQKVIDGARAVVDNYKPHIPVEPEWPTVSVNEAVDFISGYAFKSADMIAKPLDATYRPVVKIGNVGRDGRLDMTDVQFHAYTDALGRFALRLGDVVMAMTGATVGKVAVVKEDGLLVNQRVGVLRAKPTAIQTFVLHLLCTSKFYEYCQRTAGGGAQGNIAPREILDYKIPLPPLATQQSIVAEIESEQRLVASNRELITRFEKKIQSTLARVWGEDNQTGPADLTASRPAREGAPAVADA